MTEQENNRKRSKNNPNGKRCDPKTDWAKYYQKRASEGKVSRRIKRWVKSRVRKLLNVKIGTYDVRVTAILLAILKTRKKCSYWDLHEHLDEYAQDRKWCGLSRMYSRSWLHLQISSIDPAILNELILWMAQKEVARSTLIVDSSGFSINRCERWYNAKYGKGNRKIYAKLHVIRGYRGRICAAMVTGGHVGDAPQLTKMMGMIPNGTGEVLGDAAYGSIENCEAIRSSGRRPYMALKKNSVAKGFNARADMIRSKEKHPGTYYSILSKLCNVENTFSVSKCRFGGMVRALKESTQTIELLIMCVCFNMTFE